MIGRTIYIYEAEESHWLGLYIHILYFARCCLTVIYIYIDIYIFIKKLLRIEYELALAVDDESETAFQVATLNGSLPPLGPKLSNNSTAWLNTNLQPQTGPM